MTAPLHLIHPGRPLPERSVLTEEIACRSCGVVFAVQPTGDAILAAVRASWACLWLRYPDLGGWACPTHAGQWIGGRR